MDCGGYVVPPHHHNHSLYPPPPPPPGHILPYYPPPAISAIAVPSPGPIPTAAACNVVVYAYPSPLPTAATPRVGLANPYLFASSGGGGRGAQGVAVQQYPGNPLTYAAMENTVGTNAEVDDLEIKKLKLMQEGAAVDSIRVCTLCKIVCNSEKVFTSHLAGEKHAMKALRRSSEVPAVAAPNNTELTNMIVRPASESGRSNNTNAYVASQHIHCKLCKIDCSSQEDFCNHLKGKKHSKKIGKLKETAAAKSRNVQAAASVPVKDTPTISNYKNVIRQVKRKVASSSLQDLEMKRLKVLEAGADANEVKVCSLCNVVCNNQKVFDNHVAGQMHLIMAKKQVLLL